MTLSYYADRENLYRLHQRHPSWTQEELAKEVHRSRAWVCKWLGRFARELAAGVPLSVVLQGHSPRRHQPPAQVDPFIVQRLLEIRDHPPEGLRRTPGPVAILYYLPRDPLLRLYAGRLPRSSRTIYRYLEANGRLASRRPPVHDPLEPALPMQHWQLDFKDVSGAVADPTDPAPKLQHQVECCNIIDTGTSVLLSAQVQANFTAETSLLAVVKALHSYGCPEQLRVDRDPRWVGSPQGSDFPSALHRLCACLGIDLAICAARHPQQNGYVERYHRTYQEECLRVDRPATLSEARACTNAFVEHYNHERPNQARSCGNQPPLLVHGPLPTLPALPPVVDPDSWLDALDGMHMQRKIDARGSVQLDLKSYYVSKALAGHWVTLRLESASRSVQVYLQAQLLCILPLKGMVGRLLSFDAFVEHMCHQARAAHRLRSLQERRRRTQALASP
jgi:transposase InsO family protein